MAITFTEEKLFSVEQIEVLFLSVQWISGKYPQRVHKALMNSSTVITAWDEERLVGLARAMDDTEMVAYIHYVLVDPEYQGKHIAQTMIEMMLKKYKDFFYIEIMPEESKNASFYERFGFEKMSDGVPMVLTRIPKETGSE